MSTRTKNHRTYRIQPRRLALGLSQRELAEIAGVEQGHVSTAERGLTTPPWAVRKIRLALVRIPTFRRAEAKHRVAEGKADAEIDMLIETMPPSTAWTELKAAFRDRVWRYYDAGRMEEGDAVLQFLPNDEAQALLDEFFLEGIIEPATEEAA